jgi:peptidoglycan/xylan/chitin deacetylase (PgdA/CDA1 family)
MSNGYATYGLQLTRVNPIARRNRRESRDHELQEMIMVSPGKIIRRGISYFPIERMGFAARPAAVFFHGVEARVDDPCAQANHHLLADFIEISKFLRDNFEVLPLAEMPAVLRNPNQHRRAVFLMCDDGYANNLDAADVLEAFGLPWTLFVSTGHIDTAVRSPMFIARLFFLFAPDGCHRIPHLGKIELADRRQRERQGEAMGMKLKALDADRANEAVAAMAGALSNLSELLARFASDGFLSWSQLRELKRRGVEIGAHADTHWGMHTGQLSSYLTEQAVAARRKIEREVGTCRYFAYPFGNRSDVCREAWQAVRDAGYDYGFTTISGSLDGSVNPYLMPRYGLALQEPRLPSVIGSLCLGNGRLRAWQRRLA